MSQATTLALIPEAEILATWPMLPPAALRKARRKGDLAFYQFPGGAHYKIGDVEDYIERTFRKCAEPSKSVDQKQAPLPKVSRQFDGNTAATISTTHIPNGEAIGTPVDTMPESERLRAEVFEQRILSKQKGTSSRLSKQPPSPKEKRRGRQAS